VAEERGKKTERRAIASTKRKVKEGDVYTAEKETVPLVISSKKKITSQSPDYNKGRRQACRIRGGGGICGLHRRSRIRKSGGYGKQTFVRRGKEKEGCSKG